MSYDEAELVSRCQQGDQDALKEIFDRYQTKVYRIAYGVVRHREDALDIVQEVFIKLYRSIRNFQGKSNFYTYLYRMAMNTAIDHTRKKEKTPPVSLDEENAFQPAEDLEKGADRVLLKKELEGKLKAAMESLPADQKTAILLREGEGLSYQEIAEVMKCSIGTVMSRLHYARKKLQELLKDYVKEGRRE
jgi:RNA polymerase sigma-70 factor, ECF subfamily